MSDTLIIGGTTYSGVAGIKAADSSDNELTFIRPTGTKQISITENGTTTEDVAAYANAEITVNVSGGGGSNPKIVLTYRRELVNHLRLRHHHMGADRG